MSRKGRRRNSNRRKSSSSSKQSTSSIHNKSNSFSYKNDITEKSETEIFEKENVLSGSDKEKDKHNDIPSKEKRFKQDHHPNVATPESTEKGVKIITTVSIDDLKGSSPKIVFQHSQEPKSENPSNSTIAVTKLLKFTCTCSCAKLEIQEILLLKMSGIKTSFVVSEAEACLKGQCERTSNDPFEEVSQNLNEVNENIKQPCRSYTFSFHASELRDGQKNTKVVIPPTACDNSFCCQMCDSDTDVMLSSHSPIPTSASYFSPGRKSPSIRKSLSNDQIWAIPPPNEFADIRCKTLEDLTEDLTSLRIGVCSSTCEQSSFQCMDNTIYDQEHCFPFSLNEYENTNQAFCIDQLSELDNFETMFLRPSLSISRTSFTNDYINNHEKTTLMRNNSIAILQHKTCAVLKRRRQTYPGMSEGPRTIQYDFPYRESFSSGTISSLMMQSFPLQAERLGRFYQGNDSLSPFGTEYHEPLQTRRNKLSSGISKGQQNAGLFCPNKYEENPVSFSTSKHFQEHKHQPFEYPRHHEMDLEDHSYDIDKQGDYSDRDQVEQTELAESGFEEEFMEPGCHCSGTLEDEQRTLVIQVIPPSRSSSQEHMPESCHTKLTQNRMLVNNVTLQQENQDCGTCVLPKHKKSSVMTITVGASEKRSLQMDCKSSDGSSLEKQPRDNINTISEETVSSILDTDEVRLLSANDIEEVQEVIRRPSVLIANMPTPALSEIIEKTNNDQLVTRRKIIKSSERAMIAVSFPTNSSSDQEPESHRKELCKPDRAKIQCVTKSTSLEPMEHLRPLYKDSDSSSSDHWARKRKLFKESKQWSSAGGSSITSDITDESVSEDNRSMDVIMGDIQDKGFYTETFHSTAWIYRGDDISSGENPTSLSARPRAISIRERSVRINKATGEYPWGFRIKFSKPIVVTEVDTNGAAEEAGLCVGDYVLAVNGTDVTSVPHSEAADLARQGPDLLTLTIGSDIARGPNTPRPGCRGYLHKRTQSGLIKGWRRRWYVLAHDGCLSYYRHKRDEGRRQALSAVKLEGAEIGQDLTLGKPFVFKCCPLLSNRVYFFCATSNQEMKRWLDAMEKAIHPITQNHVWVDVTRHNSSLPPLAVKNPECLGLLHKMDKSKDTWMQHYCILKDACLYFYSGIRSTHALGGIYLQGYTVSEQPFGSKKSTMELRPPSDEFKTYYLCAENPNEHKRWSVAIKASISKWLPLCQVIQDYMNRPPEETKM